MLGPFGEHPSRICGEVAFEVAFDRKPARQVRELIEDCLQAGLSGYVGVYGDKTKVTDPGTGQPMVQKHYLLRPASSGFEVRVYGAAGHMGSVKERDGAITKMAHLVRSLALSRQRIEAVGGAKFRLEIAPRSKAPRTPLSDTVILEGGQGFVPTHSIEEIMERLRRAAQRGAENVLRQMGTNPEELVRVTFEKLHNVAFDGEPDSASMRNAVTAAEACGIWKDEPVLGWTVSCDARLFASEYPGMDVLTFGPGKLGFAHSDHEQIALEEIRKAVEFLCGFLLLQTGTIG
jgi:acetylornithine deacetylase/succinyl-diaminopimelate desuccinylase-like protein